MSLDGEGRDNLGQDLVEEAANVDHFLRDVGLLVVLLLDYVGDVVHVLTDHCPLVARQREERLESVETALIIQLVDTRKIF